MDRKRWFFSVLAIGLVVRIVLAPIAGHPWDMYVYYTTGQAIVSGEPFYGVTQYPYPPVWAGILWPITLVYNQLAAIFGAFPITGGEAQAIIGVPVGTPLVADWLFHLLENVPLILSDTLLGLLLYRVVARRFGKPQKALQAFALFYLNPYVIWITSVWGTFDTLPTYFALFGTLLFLEKRGFASGTTFGIAIALKFFPAFLLLSLVLGLHKRVDRHFIRNLLAGVAVVLAIVSIPFLVSDPIAYLRGIWSPAGGVFVGNLSVWSLLLGLGIQNLPAWIAVLNIAAIVVLIALISWIVGKHQSLSANPALWIDLIVLALLVFYALFRIINDQYVFWIIPFLTLDAVLGRERWQTVIGVSALVVISGLVNVAHYSFFLPILTISPDLLWLIPRMWDLPILRGALAIVFWLVVLRLLWLRLRRLVPKGGILRFLKLETRRFLHLRRGRKSPEKRAIRSALGPPDNWQLLHMSSRRQEHERLWAKFGCRYEPSSQNLGSTSDGTGPCGPVGSRLNARMAILKATRGKPLIEYDSRDIMSGET